MYGTPTQPLIRPELSVIGVAAARPAVPVEGGVTERFAPDEGAERRPGAAAGPGCLATALLVLATPPAAESQCVEPAELRERR